jgi:hypothetical protein
MPNQRMTTIDDAAGMQINLRWLIQMLAVTALAVWAYFGIGERLTLLEKDTVLMQMGVKANSEFRIKWPRGELGSLPDDAEQNMRLNFAERQLKKHEELLDEISRKVRLNGN